jgi:uncharacterized protein (TIRG00374 family)
MRCTESIENASNVRRGPDIPPVRYETANMRAGKWRRWASLTLKILVSLGLVALALRGIDLAEVRRHLASPDWISIAVSVTLATSIALLHALRWRIVLVQLGRGISFPEGLRLVLIGYFFNQTLPSTIGGDGVRMWGAYRLGVPAPEAISSVVIDRIMALGSLVLMIVIGLPWLFGIITAPLARWTVVLVIAAATLAIMLLASLGRFASTLHRWRPTRMLLPIAHGLRALISRVSATSQVVALTVVAYALVSVVVHVLARGLFVELSVADALLLIPLVTLVAVLPISIAGWGVRENAMIVALGLIGVPAVAALSVSLLYGLVTMATGVPGGILWLIARRRMTTGDVVGPNPKESK